MLKNDWRRIQRAKLDGLANDRMESRSYGPTYSHETKDANHRKVDNLKCSRTIESVETSRDVRSTGKSLPSEIQLSCKLNPDNLPNQNHDPHIIGLVPHHAHIPRMANTCMEESRQSQTGNRRGQKDCYHEFIAKLQGINVVNGVKVCRKECCNEA